MEWLIHNRIEIMGWVIAIVIGYVFARFLINLCDEDERNLW